MDPMERVKLERRIDQLVDVKDGDVKAHALQAREELKAKRWNGAIAFIEKAEAAWKRVKPGRVIDMLVVLGRAKTPAQARHLVESGRVRVNDVVLRKPFASAGPHDTITVDGQA